MSKPIFKWNLFRAMWTAIALNPGATAASAFECDEMRDFQKKYCDTHRPIKCDYTAEAIKYYVPFADDYTSEQWRNFWPINWYGDPEYPNQHLLHVYREAVAQRDNDPEVAMRIAERIRDLPLTSDATYLYEIDAPNVCYIILDEDYQRRQEMGHIIAPVHRYLDIQMYIPKKTIISSKMIDYARDECHIALYEQISAEVPCIAIGTKPTDVSLIRRIESTAIFNNYVCATITPVAIRPQYASLVSCTTDSDPTAE